MNRKLVLIVGGIAVVVAIVFLIFGSENKEQIDYIAQLETRNKAYGIQMEAKSVEIMEMNTRVNELSSQRDTARAANLIIKAKLNQIQGEVRRYTDLYKKQVSLNRELRNELSQVRNELKQERVQREAAVSRAKELESQLAQKDDELVSQAARIRRLETSLKAEQRARNAVLVYQGTQKELQDAGYLSVRQKTIFTNEYKMAKFPDEKDAAVVTAEIGSEIVVKGEVKLLADREGKLSKKKEYDLKKQEDGSSTLVFKDETLKGLKVLVVLK